MWNVIKINEENLFFKCHVDDVNVKYSLSDLKEIWTETLSVEDGLVRAKEFNKRIQFDDEIVLNTITTTIPKQATFDDRINSPSNRNLRFLNLKYYIEDLPFTFNWKLELAPQSEFQTTITNPLLFSINFLTKQSEELQDIIKKKDIEIEQYKIEGAELKRTTVRTVPFQLENFKKKYSKISPVTKELLTIFNESEDLQKQCDEYIYHIEEEQKAEMATSFKKTYLSAKKGPRERKRKFFDQRRNIMKQRLEAQEKDMAYDSDSPSNSVDDLHSAWKQLESERISDMEGQTTK